MKVEIWSGRWTDDPAVPNAGPYCILIDGKPAGTWEMDITPMLKMAHAAGAAGELFEVVATEGRGGSDTGENFVLNGATPSQTKTLTISAGGRTEHREFLCKYLYGDRWFDADTFRLAQAFGKRVKDGEITLDEIAPAARTLVYRFGELIGRLVVECLDRLRIIHDSEFLLRKILEDGRLNHWDNLAALSARFDDIEREFCLDGCGPLFDRSIINRVTEWFLATIKNSQSEKTPAGE